MVDRRRDARRAGLIVPAAEAAEVAPGRILHRREPVVGGHRLAVEAIEIEVGAGAEALGPKQRVEHPDDLRALVVDRRGVEIADLDIGVGADRMGQRAGVLGELRAAQHPHVVDAGDGGRALVGGELLVAEDGQAFLQRQLEPVAAGDAVARPVVEILVRDNGGDGVEIVVGRGFGIGQDVLRVEDVEALVLHRPGVEVGDGDEVEGVEVVFAPVILLVPAKGGLQRRHGVGAARQVGLGGPDGQRHHLARGGGEAVAQRAEPPGDDGEQVARLRPGIDPLGEVTAVRQRPVGLPLAVRQQHRIAHGVGLRRTLNFASTSGRSIQ